MLSGKNDTESVIRAFTDLSNVISGKLNEPDVLADYHVMFKVFEKQVNDEFSIGFSAGPGAFAGYVVTKSSKCAVGGLSGIASLDFGFNVPITVSLGLSCELGFCISPGYRDDYTLKLYKYGLSRSWIPELTIAYSF